MQTPKARSSSSGAPPRISPRSYSLEAPDNNSPRAELSKKHSPRAARQLKTGPRYSEPTASFLNLATKPPKDKSPNVRKSPRSPLPEEKRPSRGTELECQISQLESDLENVKDQLCSSVTSKEQAQKDAEELNEQLSALSLKLEELDKRVSERSASGKVDIIELSKPSEEQEETLQSDLEALQKQRSHDSAALASALDEIDQLKARLEIVAESEAVQTKPSESARIEIHKLKEELAEALVSVEDMKNRLSDCKKSEAQAKELVGETLMQLETAKKMVEALRSDGCKAHDAVKFELEQSRARVSFLEELVSKLKAEISSLHSKDPHNGDEPIDMDVDSVKLEVKQLRRALQVAEIRQNEEEARCEEQIRNAFGMVEQIKSASGQREAELEAELRKSRYEIEELMANFMDKETELQGICEENDTLIMQVENMVSIEREHELEKEIGKLKTDIENVKARLNKLSEENEVLKSEINYTSKRNEMYEEIMRDLEEARAAEREALMRVGYVTEEVDKSNRKAARVAEQLEAAQAANAEMEVELRKLKVQSDQWRKAAEVAANMLSVGNNGQLMERTGSMDNFSPRTRRMGLHYEDDFDDDGGWDCITKKNVNVLRRFGVLWKKQQK